MALSLVAGPAHRLEIGRVKWGSTLRDSNDVIDHGRPCTAATDGRAGQEPGTEGTPSRGLVELPEFAHGGVYIGTRPHIAGVFFGVRRAEPLLSELRAARVPTCMGESSRHTASDIPLAQSSGPYSANVLGGEVAARSDPEVGVR